MKIELHKITVRELTNGYVDNNENGVRAYGGKLDVRPPFQREFVYKEKQRDAVIDTLTQGFPLNVMYWAVRNVADCVSQSGSTICGDANGDNETFAFINNGNIIITEDMADATLQVVDVMGHIIVSYDGRTRCVPTGGMTPGVYVLRLLRGNDVRTQKIVIEK